MGFEKQGPDLLPDLFGCPWREESAASPGESDHLLDLLSPDKRSCKSTKQLFQHRQINAELGKVHIQVPSFPARKPRGFPKLVSNENGT